MKEEKEQQTQLEDLWVIMKDDYVEFACPDCARKFAEDNNIPADDYGGYRVEDQFGNVTAESTPPPPWGHGFEMDYPPSCNCGTYLETSLTDEAVWQLIEHDFPAYVWELYGLKKEEEN